MMNWNLLKKIRIIILSRIKKTKTNNLVEQKRDICKYCEYNTINIEKIPLNKLILKRLSDFYSFVTGNSDVDVLGNCVACETCSVYYKSRDEEDCPHPDGDKWKSVYIPNSAQNKLKRENEVEITNYLNSLSCEAIKTTVLNTIPIKSGYIMNFTLIYRFHLEKELRLLIENPSKEFIKSIKPYKSKLYSILKSKYFYKSEIYKSKI